MRIIILSLFLILFTDKLFSQSQTVLDNSAMGYFTPEQIDTMSVSYKKAMNYLVRYSWDIYRRNDKRLDTIVVFNRDTIDIRPFLKARQETQRTWIYDIYAGLAIVLHSKSEIKAKLHELNLQ